MAFLRVFPQVRGTKRADRTGAKQAPTGCRAGEERPTRAQLSRPAADIESTPPRSERRGRPRPSGPTPSDHSRGPHIPSAPASRGARLRCASMDSRARSTVRGMDRLLELQELDLSLDRLKSRQDALQAGEEATAAKRMRDDAQGRL